MWKTKVVFLDAGREKVIVGITSFEDGFVKVVADNGNVLHINKEHIIFMKEADY